MSNLNLTKSELVMALSLGRELEFHIGENAYFIGLIEQNYYYISREDEKKIIFSGSLDCVYKYVFPEGISIECDFEKFTFDYLL